MKWFKHMSNASNDAFIEGLEEEFGLEGYARWWKLLEVIAASMDESGECFAEHSISKWRSFLKCFGNKLSLFLVYLENKSKIKVDKIGNSYKIYCPKMLDLRDEWTARKKGKLGSNSAATPAKKKKQETDIEIPPTPQGGACRFEEFWEFYPKRVAKAAAKRAWDRNALNKDADTIIAAVKRYSATETWQKDKGQFIPYPATFLNGKRWEDEIGPIKIAEQDKIPLWQTLENWLDKGGMVECWLDGRRFARPELKFNPFENEPTGPNFNNYQVISTKEIIETTAFRVIEEEND